MGCRRRGKSGLCWRGVAKVKGFAGRPTPTWAAAGAENPGPVGVTWRRIKALRGGPRQHGLPPARKVRALLAWRDEGQRLCREAHTNMGCRRRGKSGPCWRDVAKDKGFAGRPTPTWAAAGAESPGPVGVARRRSKALQGGPHQHGLPPALKIRVLLAWRDEVQRLCGEAHANMGCRAPRKSPGPKANNLISPKKRNTSQKVVLYKNHMSHWHMVLQMHR